MECLNKTVYFHFCMKNVSCVVKSRFTLYYKYTYIVMGTLKVLVVIISDYYQYLYIIQHLYFTVSQVYQVDESDNKRVSN